ncbi:MAG: hypothetical protein H6592_13700 [Flavobacteriales bacterium]|nr:hypothetical protein [Flavobacteriales bacterium]
MRTKNFLKHLILGALLLTTGKVVGQVSTGSNVAAFGTDFLGWNTNPANSLIPLQVRHNLNQPIEWYTNGLQRMKLFPNVSPVINGYGGLPRNGSLVFKPWQGLPRHEGTLPSNALLLAQLLVHGGDPRMSGPRARHVLRDPAAGLAACGKEGREGGSLDRVM